MSDHGSSNPTGSTEDLLARVPLFAELNQRSLRRLAKLCIPRSYSEGTEIITEGSTGLGMFLITAGRVEIFKSDEDSTIPLAVMKAGDILGEMALVDDRPRSASAVALEPTRCLLITRDSFHTLRMRDPEIAWCVVPTLATRLRALQTRVIEGEFSDAVPEPVGRAGTPVPRTIGKAVRADSGAEPDLESEDQGEDDSGGPGVRLLREQYALMMAGVTGLQGSARLLGVFLRTLAAEAELSDSSGMTEVARRTPRGMVGALRKALSEAEKLPEQMISTFRRHRTP